MDYTAITSAIDFSGALTAVGVAFAAVALVYIGMKGGRLVISALK